MIVIRDGTQSVVLWSYTAGPADVIPSLVEVLAWVKQTHLLSSASSVATWLITKNSLGRTSPTDDFNRCSKFELAQGKRPQKNLRPGDYVYRIALKNTNIRLLQIYEDEQGYLERTLGSLRKMDTLGVQRFLTKLGIPYTPEQVSPVEQVAQQTYITTESTTHNSVPTTYSLLGGVLASRSQTNYVQSNPTTNDSPATD